MKDKIIAITPFFNGIARAANDKNKYNFIDTTGKVLFPELWFKYVDYYSGGFARVQRDDGRWNFIDKKGNILLPKWVRKVLPFCNNYARVLTKKDEWNYINKSGELMLRKMHIIFATDFLCDNVAYIQRKDSKWNALNENCSLISPNKWFDSIAAFGNGNKFLLIYHGQHYFIGHDKQMHKFLFTSKMSITPP